MAFADDVAAALAAPLGGPLGRRILAATMTAIVADAAGDARDIEALAALVAALERAGVPRRRQFVLLAGDVPADLARSHARRVRTALGLPALPHDPDGPAYVAGTLADGTALALDDELREAEEIVLCGAFGPDPELGVRGGPAALWPGLADRAGRDAFVRALGAAQGAARRRAALDAASAALAIVPAAFALTWSAAPPARVIAGEPGAVLAAAAGWAGAAPDAERGAAR